MREGIDKMTEKHSKQNKKRSFQNASPRQLTFCFITLFSLALIIKNSDLAIKYMSEGLLLCVRTVIPSLFPFMVISDMIVASGAAEFIGRILRVPMRFLFGVSGEGGCSAVLGILCGFPIGAKSAVSMYDTGKISKNELERLLTFANNPSSAFIISAVGVSLFGSRAIGILLYSAILLSSLVVGIAQNIIFRKLKSNFKQPLPTQKSSNKKAIVGDFTEAVTSSTFGILKICAFVLFFTAIMGVFSSALAASELSDNVRTILFGFFEMTGGISQAAFIRPIERGIIIAAFIGGWSGISVHFQIMSLCADRNISFKPYFIAKLCQGILSALITKLCLLLFPHDFIFHSNSLSVGFHSVIVKSFELPILVCFAFVLVLSVIKK